MGVKASDAEAAKGGDFKARQYAILPGGSVYGAVFQGYTEPKMYKEYVAPGAKDLGNMVKKIGLKFLVTNKMNNKPLKERTEAFIMVPFKFFFDPNGKMGPSNFFAFFAAMLADKYTAAEIGADNFAILRDIDLNTLVGKPLNLLLDQYENKKQGVTQMTVKKFLPADDDMREAIAEVMETAVYEENETTGIKFLKSPTAHYEEEDDEDEKPATAAKKSAADPAPKATGKKAAEPPPEDDIEEDIPF